jgi:hypothetical protein
VPTRVDDSGIHKPGERLLTGSVSSTGNDRVEAQSRRAAAKSYFKVGPKSALSAVRITYPNSQAPHQDVSLERDRLRRAHLSAPQT